MDNYTFIINHNTYISFTQREDEGVTINFHGKLPAVIHAKHKEGFAEVVNLVMSYEIPEKSQEIEELKNLLQSTVNKYIELKADYNALNEKYQELLNSLNKVLSKCSQNNNVQET